MLKPFFIKKKNIDSRLVPVVSAADAGKVLGVTEDGKIAAVEAGGGGGGTEWTPKFTLHLTSSGLRETLSEIQAFDPQIGDRVLLDTGNESVYMIVGKLTYSGASLSSATFVTDVYGPYIVLQEQINLSTGDLELVYVDTQNNSKLSPVALIVDTTGVTMEFYNAPALFSVTRRS